MENKSTGLIKHRPSKRDYSHYKTFGAVPLLEMPEEYLLPSTILDQNGWNECTAYESQATKESSISGNGRQFNPDWFFMKELQRATVGDKLTGVDMRTKMLTGLKKNDGFLPMVISSVSAKEKGLDYVVNPQNWNTKFDEAAKKEGFGAFFHVDGPYDVFDSIRNALWMIRDEKIALSVGTMWYNDWLAAKEGIITAPGVSPIGLHDIKCAGWTKKKRNGMPLPELPNGDPYLAIQNSYGEGYGDHGWFYFPRAVVNKEFIEGIFYWTDKTVDPAFLQRVGFILSIIQQIVLLLTRLARKAGISI